MPVDRDSIPSGRQRHGEFALSAKVRGCYVCHDLTTCVLNTTTSDSKYHRRKLARVRFLTWRKKNSLSQVRIRSLIRFVREKTVGSSKGI